jgi:hypothetical protein
VGAPTNKGAHFSAVALGLEKKKTAVQFHLDGGAKFSGELFFRRGKRLGSDVIFPQDLLLEIRMRLAVHNEMLDKIGYGRKGHLIILNDLRGLGLDKGNIPLRVSGLETQKYHKRAADNDQHKQLKEYLAA